MTPAGFIVGLLLIGAGIFLIIWLRKKMLGTAETIQYTETSTIGQIVERWQQLNSQGLGNNYREVVEVKGIASVENPPITPYTSSQCAYYCAELDQVYEEEVVSTDKDGRTTRRMEKRESNLAKETSSEPVMVSDNSCDSTISLDLMDGGLKLDLVKHCERFEPHQNMHTYAFFSSFHYRPMGNRTLGFKMKEWIMPLNSPLYILGEVYERAGSLFIGRPQDRNVPFIISTKSETQLVDEAKTNATLSLVGGIVLIALGIGAMLFWKQIFK